MDAMLKPSNSGKVKPRTGWWIAATAAAVIIIILAGMLPVYFSFKKVNDEQEEPYVYPFGLTSQEAEALSDSVFIFIDLTILEPGDHSVKMSVEVIPNAFTKDVDLGVVEMDKDLMLDVAVGHQSITYENGDHFADHVLEYSLEDSFPGFLYPFDAYDVDLKLRAFLINTTDESDKRIPISISVLLAKQGWKTNAQMRELDPGNTSGGVHIDFHFERSISVQFFSIFIVVIMWLISLVAFALALLYVSGDPNDTALDVPALEIALLFAMPFVRDVMPEVPLVGIRIDLLGYFWNMMLITISTVLALGKAYYAYRARLAL